MPTPAGSPFTPPGPAPAPLEARVPADSGSDGASSAPGDTVPAEDATAAINAGPSPYDHWIGMTEADVRRVIARTHPTVRLNGSAKLSVRGRTWLIEYEVRNCSDWTTRIELVFEHQRVVRATEVQGRWTGKLCADEHGF
jgi:hypothetical protein